MKEGTPLTEVQKLCDIHSALFHGATKEEKIANAEKEVEASVLRKKAQRSGEAEGFPEEGLGANKNAMAAALRRLRAIRCIR